MSFSDSYTECIDCKTHEFQFGELTETPTCARTNEISSCLHCDKNYHKITSMLLRQYHENKQHDLANLTIPINHFHIWRHDGTCGSKLNFPDDKDGNNYGFEKKPYGILEIPERRKCNALRQK